MPELPEVENLRIGLEKVILDQKILNIEVKNLKIISGKGTTRTASTVKAKEFKQGLEGEKFTGVKRRAKNLIFELSHDKFILAHLKMTGQFAYHANDGKNKINGGHPIEISETSLPNKHTHVIFKLEKGNLYYNDTRKFGYVLYFESKKSFDKEDNFNKLGLEPLDKYFNVKYLAENLKNKKGKVKALLLDQSIVTGIGNIYADESLFESGIMPTRIGSTLTQNEVTKLHSTLIRIIKRAIKVGGSSVATYRLIDESKGNYAREHKVYGKTGKPCLNCQTTLEKTVVQGRTTVFCNKCQK